MAPWMLHAACMAAAWLPASLQVRVVALAAELAGLRHEAATAADGLRRAEADAAAARAAAREERLARWAWNMGVEREPNHTLLIFTPACVPLT